MRCARRTMIVRAAVISVCHRSFAIRSHCSCAHSMRIAACVYCLAACANAISRTRANCSALVGGSGRLARLLLEGIPKLYCSAFRGRETMQALEKAGPWRGTPRGAGPSTSFGLVVELQRYHRLEQTRQALQSAVISCNARPVGALCLKSRECRSIPASAATCGSRTLLVRCPPPLRKESLNRATFR